MVTRHMLSKGWKKPAYISGVYYSTSEQRYIGYQSALYESNINLQNEYVVFAENLTKPYLELGYEAMKRMLKLPDRRIPWFASMIFLR